MTQDNVSCQGQTPLEIPEAKGMNPVAEANNPFLEQEIETIAVIVAQKNRLAAVTAKDDMIDSAGDMYARFACHAGNDRSFIKVVNLEA